MSTIPGPFGPARLVLELPPGVVEGMYRAKCDADVDFAAMGVSSLDLYECQRTGMRFWRPERIAGDEAFYQQLSRKWPFYYRDWRWEYGPALGLLRPSDRVLEVGCGRGYFLRWTEERVRHAQGIEFNREAIAAKMTRWDIVSETIAQRAEHEPGGFDVVCSFQVLEHVVDPAGFLADCLGCLRPGGRLVLSTPDPENRALRNREDAFDLPPHHMNHFPLSSYRAIADMLGLGIERVFRAPLIPWASRPPGDSTRPPLREALRTSAYNLAAKVLGKRGPTLMVSLRKPGQG